jgi:formamidopyrimidine-DNA glycosylase
VSSRENFLHVPPAHPETMKRRDTPVGLRPRFAPRAMPAMNFSRQEPLMPELPEVANFRKYFETHALNLEIASVRVKDPRIVRGLSADELERALSGRRFISARQHGKYLFAATDRRRWFIMHFGMTGYIHYFESLEDDPKYDRLLIEFEKGGFLSYVNQRMLGGVGLVEDPDDFIEGKGLGPSALDSRLDYRRFRKIFSGLNGRVKPALMNQSLIAGIGNIYADEILFQSRIHPETKVGSLGKKDLKSIFDNLKQVLRTALDRNAEFANLPEQYLLRDRRKGAGCPICGTRLETVKVGGRTSYFCPKCQKTP